MIWNYCYNRPLGHYKEQSLSPEDFRNEVSAWLEEMRGQWPHLEKESEKRRNLREEAINQNIRYALESVNYDLDMFMLSHAYYQIEDPFVRKYFLMCECLMHSPSCDFIQYIIDECAEDCDYSILRKAEDMLRRDYHETISDADILCRYYFCEMEEDVWDIFAEGVGDISDLCYFYTNKDKAMQMLLYVYGDDDKFLSFMTGETYQICPPSVREEIASIMMDRFFGGMYDSFFDEDNYELALSAWQTGIPEIRKEFVRDDHAVEMLKKILTNKPDKNHVI